ncbi:pEARLI1-like lipid transfer protein 3 [Linum perenne]
MDAKPKTSFTPVLVVTLLLVVSSLNSAEPVSATSGRKCSINLLGLAACAPLLGAGGQLASEPCCAALLGLTDLDAAVCLCLALKADLLGINVDVPLAINLVLSTCKRNTPRDFKCK